MENNFAGTASVNTEYLPPKAAEENFTGRERAFAFISVGLGFIFVKLLAAPVYCFGETGLGASVFLVLFTLFCALYPAQGKRMQPKRVLRLALCILFSVNVFICSDRIIQLLDAVFGFLVLVFDSLAGSDDKFNRIGRFFPLDMLTGIIILPFSRFDKAGAAIKQQTSQSSMGSTVRNTVLGLFIAVPSTITAACLLMNADDGFSDMLGNFIGDGFEQITIALIQLIAGIPVGAYIFGMCMASCRKDAGDMIDDERREKGISSLRFLPAAAGVSSAVPLCGLYVMFFFSQLSYFISAFSLKLPCGMETYAVYARRGFFELCAVSVINLAAISGINFFCKNNSENKKPASIRIITAVLGAFTILLIITALSKMAMYISFYGLTLLRVFTSWFMVLLGIIFAGIIISAVKENINLSRLAVTSFVIMFSLLSFSGVDGIIAEYNTERYLDGTLNSFDPGIVSELSEGAVPVLCRAADKLPEDERYRLIDAMENKLDKSRRDFRTITLSGILAEKAFENLDR